MVIFKLSYIFILLCQFLRPRVLDFLHVVLHRFLKKSLILLLLFEITVNCRSGFRQFFKLVLVGVKFLCVLVEHGLQLHLIALFELITILLHLIFILLLLSLHFFVFCGNFTMKLVFFLNTPVKLLNSLLKKLVLSLGLFDGLVHFFKFLGKLHLYSSLHILTLLGKLIIFSICIGGLLFLELDTLKILILRRFKLGFQIEMLSLHRLFHFFDFRLISSFSMKDLLISLIQLVDSFFKLRLELLYLLLENLILLNNVAVFIFYLFDLLKNLLLHILLFLDFLLQFLNIDFFFPDDGLLQNISDSIEIHAF